MEAKNEYKPDYAISPLYTLAELTDYLKLTSQFLDDVLAGRIPLSDAVIERIAVLTETPPGFWERLDHNYRQTLAVQDTQENCDSG